MKNTPADILLEKKRMARLEREDARDRLTHQPYNLWEITPQFLSRLSPRVQKNLFNGLHNIVMPRSIAQAAGSNLSLLMIAATGHLKKHEDYDSLSRTVFGLATDLYQATEPRSDGKEPIITPIDRELLKISGIPYAALQNTPAADQHTFINSYFSKRRFSKLQRPHSDNPYYDPASEVKGDQPYKASIVEILRGI